MKSKKNIVIIISSILLVVVAGLAVWLFVFKDDSNPETNNASSKTSQAEIDSCEKNINDKDLCKFFASWKEVEKFKAVSTNISDGVSSVSTIKVDGDNSHIILEGDYPMEIITIGDDSYTKAGDVWWKESNKAAQPDDDENYTIDTGDYNYEESEMDNLDYKKLGKESCGEFSCFKYQMLDMSDNEILSHYVWFDDSSYMIRKVSTENIDGTSTEQVFSYEDFTISIPSPVQELGENQYIMPGSSEPVTMPDFDDYEY